jgi:uncharacterized protein YeaO (DUF488 family)
MPNVEEGYFGNLKNYPENELFVVVSRYYPRWLKKGLPFHPELAPSKELLADWKAGSISWEVYEKRFREEMKEEKSVESIDDLAWASQYDVFRLLCYEKEPPCHRFILIDLVNESLNEHNKIYEENSEE